MNSPKILVTGCAGFIGMHLCKALLKNGNEIFGIDNLNNYYSPILKNARLNELKCYDNFTFSKVDLTDKNSLVSIFQLFKPSKVVNLAAQVGVRNSLKNPEVYAESNIIGFLNLLECCKNFNIEGLIYASSSSVYGDKEEGPFIENKEASRRVDFAVRTKTKQALFEILKKLSGGEIYQDF